MFRSSPLHLSAAGITPLLKVAGRWLAVACLCAGSAHAQNGPRLDGPPSSAQQTVSAAATAQTTQSTTADGFTVWREDIDSSCSYSDHNYSLDINSDPSEMSEIQYTMTNYDVDYVDTSGACAGGPEVDVFSFNGNPLGVLTGANNSWSVNTYALTQSQIVNGSNAVKIDTDSTGTGCWCVGVGYIEVRAKVGFNVQSRTPAANEQNRAFAASDVDLTVTFSSDYDPASVTASTFALEYRDAAGSWQSVAGSYESVNASEVRMVPSADLKDGIRYRVTLKSGANGVLSTAGGQLAADEQWDFWTVPDLDVTDSFGGSACASTAASTCPGLEAAIFQVSRNEPLSIGKDAVARVYMRWVKHADVLDADQVQQLSADIELDGGGISTSTSGTVSRPDLWTSAQLQSAGNSVNVYHRPTSGADYTVKVTPKPQSNKTSVVYQADQSASSNGTAPTLSFDYYFIKDGNWSGGVPTASRSAGIALLSSGTQYAEDAFPLSSATYNTRSDLQIGYTYTGNTVAEGSCGNVQEVACPTPAGGTIARSELRCTVQALANLRGSRSVIAASTGNALCPGATAFALGKVFIAQDGSGANAETVGHELGHVYGLVAGSSTRHRDSSTGLEGFQVRTRVNRSITENPAQAISLMHTVVQQTGTQWIHNLDYETLLGNAGSFLIPTQLQSASMVAAAATTSYITLSGVVDFTSNQIVLYPAYLLDEPADTGSSSGSCSVELRNGQGVALATTHVTPGDDLTVYGSSEESNDAASQSDAAFQVSLPWDDSAQSIVMNCGTGFEATLVRSAHDPVASIASPTDGTVVSGTISVNWDLSDEDGDTLSSQLQLSVDGGSSWDAVSLFSAATSASVDTSQLANGALALRVMVSDGFNVAYAYRNVTVANALALHSTSPYDGATDVPVGSQIKARFQSDIDSATLTTTSFTLVAGSTSVAATLSYDAASRVATLTPTAALTPSTTYTARLSSAIKGAGGEAFSTTQWSFTTEADRYGPSIVELAPLNGASGVPLNALLQVRFDKAIDTATLTTDSIRLTSVADDLPVDAALSYSTSDYRLLVVPSATLTPGWEYRLAVSTAVEDASGKALTGPAEARFQTGDTLSDGVRIVGNYSDAARDDDADGRYDALDINAQVEILTAGTYNLNGRLLDSSGRLIDWASSGNVSLQRGVHSLTLSYDSVPISNSGLDGPYVLDALNLYSTSNPDISDVEYQAWQTRAYDVEDFASVMRVGPLPDQVLKVDQGSVNAFNLEALSTHETEPVTSIGYSVLVNSDSRVGVSIDSDSNVWLQTTTGNTAESDVTILAEDTLGNQVVSRFHVSVQVPYAAALSADYASSMSVGETQTITVTVLDQFDALYADALALDFSATLGSVEPSSTSTQNGVASVEYAAGTVPGPSVLTVAAANASPTLTLAIDIASSPAHYRATLINRDVISRSTQSQFAVGLELHRDGKRVTDEAVGLELVLDATGQVVRDQDMTAGKRRYGAVIDIGDLAAARYTLRATVSSSGEAFTGHVLIRR